jgi:aminomethyltransferase
MIKKTPLNEVHKSLGARMVEYAGWEMPVQYAGPIPEHMAVRERAGLFDVSHMGEVEVRGPDALEVVDRIVASDPRTLVDNQAQYSVMLNESAGIVDDLLIYRMSSEEYFLVVNAGTTDKDFAWISSHAKNADCEVINHSPAYAQIAIQGPSAEAILQNVVKASLDRIPSFWFQRTKLDGRTVIVSRTGYTGEDGFEIYTYADDAVFVWNRLMVEGADVGIQPCGLAARNTLRLEAKLALYGNDIDDSTTPYEAGLKWVVKADKGDFVGRDALLAAPVERKLVGFEVKDRAPARDDYPVVKDGREVGVVTSGSPAPYLKKNIGLAYVPNELAAVGTELGILVRNREVPAEVVKTPFYKRKRVFD